jgi:FhuF 2Fe-2S C-terminal domain
MLGGVRAGEHPDQVSDVTAVPALFAVVAGIGPFFAVATGPEPASGGWVPVRHLTREPGTSGDPLAARIATVQTALRTDARVAASTAFQGLAAQLVAPLFAAVAVCGALPAAAVDATDSASWRPVARPDPVCPRDHEAGAGLADGLHWRPGGAGPWLWWSGAARVVPCRDAEVLGNVLRGLLAPLAAAVRARVPVAERVLWGNAASAVASARRLVVAARPEALERATALAEGLLVAPPLARTGDLRAPEPPDVRWTFRRRSCCLYYRVPGGGICDDCVLRDRGT